MSRGHIGRGRPKNTWKRDLEKMWTVGYKGRAGESGGGSTEQS